MESNLGINIIASCILASTIPILIMSVGMGIYNSAINSAFESIESTDNESSVISEIKESSGMMSKQERDAFNNQFKAYEGERTGSQVKALLGVLIANASTYEEEPQYIPSVIIGDKIDSNKTDVKDAIMETKNDLDDYHEKLGKMRNLLENHHTYTVEFEYSNNDIINEVIINYGE